ncbi:hypothetical protein [Leifsonia virtsii]|uniref:Uncharacterized protein n=1 Tax=Leifsonia virtsii TaxID=3035915 RepID=A0ABT8IYZ7_9MICO|nr:hypothetical protein [Leifsonia virtsii]MDN4598029.1 hypothetical protein [Leifsonia virtsii]
MFETIPQDEGKYLVTTESGSTYVFDLENRTVSRTPGPRSRPDFTDGTYRLIRVIQGTVGISGLWTMLPPTDELQSAFEYFWQATSPIVSIMRIQEPE